MDVDTNESSKPPDEEAIDEPTDSANTPISESKKRKFDNSDDFEAKKFKDVEDEIETDPLADIENNTNSDNKDESISLSDILGEGIETNKTVQLSEIFDNPDDVLTPSEHIKEEEEDADESEDTTEKPSIENKVDEADDDDDHMDFDISEKLREMGEISVQPVSKNNLNNSEKQNLDTIDDVSLEITKRSSSDKGSESAAQRKVTNLRKNIKEVMDDNQLDASTLAAQRQELERLSRVQEQQRIIREVQRQIALERQNSKAQARVMSLLQGHTSLLKNAQPGTSTKITLPGSGGTVLMKIPASEAKNRSLKQSEIEKNNLTPSVSIAPVKSLASRDTKFVTLDEEDEEEEDDEDYDESDSDTGGAPSDIEETKEKKEVVTIDSSSDDDCILLSDDEEPEDEGDDDPQNSGLHVNDTYNVPDSEGRVVINIGHPESEQDIFLAPQIGRIIKPHQIGGVRFLFDNIIESIERFDTSTGFGCILAHSMGLGKTLQLVCFCDIFLRHTSSKTILIIMPINTLQNWMSEFNMWLPESDENCPLKIHGEVRTRNFKLHVLNDSHKTLKARAKVVLEWASGGGVLLIGYEMYRLLSLKKMTKKKKKKTDNIDDEEKEDTDEQKTMFDQIHEALVKPGPDLVICDEGHRIKNSHASISVALKQIKSKRRVVLTGYPLQNNLLEYWCMVDFVRPNYLGTKTEFANMFERPIQNGQCIDSTPNDIKLMRYRAHVLHSLLLGFVQRRSHAVLQTSLPQKNEYVLLVRMTPFQRELYTVFMNEVVRTKTVPNPLKAFAVCCKIWNHPDVLYNFLKKREADLDLELEEAEAAANAAAITAANLANNVAIVDPNANKKGKSKKAASPRKPRLTKKQQQLQQQAIEKDGKIIPAATITPNTGSTYNSACSSTSSNSNNSNSAKTYPTTIPTTTALFNENSSSDLTNHMNNNYPQIKQEPQWGANNGKIMGDSNYNQFNNNQMLPNSQSSQMHASASGISGTSMQQQSLNQSNHNDSNSNMNDYSQQNYNNYYNQSNNPYNAYNNHSSVNNNYYNHQQYNNSNYYQNQSYDQNYQNYGNSNYWGSSNYYQQQQHSQSMNSHMNYNNQQSNSSYMDYNNQMNMYSNQNYGQNHNYSNYGQIEPKVEPPWPQSNNQTQQASNHSMQTTPNSMQSSTNSNQSLTQTNSMQSSTQSMDTSTQPLQSTNSSMQSTSKPMIPTTIKEEIKSADISMESDIKEEKVDAKKEESIKSPLISAPSSAPSSVLTSDTNEPSDDKKSEDTKDDVKEAIDIKEIVKAAASKDDGIPYDWAVELMKNYVADVLENAPKMNIFFCILEESVRLGDRMLVFSQSLLTLNIIEKFLQKTKIYGTENYWGRNTNYYSKSLLLLSKFF